MEAERPRPPEAKSDAEIEAELERLSQEAQAKFEADQAALTEQRAHDAEARDELAKAMRSTSALGAEAEAAAGMSLGGKLVVGALALVGLLVLWGLVIKPLLGLALVVGVIALLGFGVWKLLELGGGDDDEAPKA